MAHVFNRVKIFLYAKQSFPSNKSHISPCYIQRVYPLKINDFDHLLHFPHSPAASFTIIIPLTTISFKGPSIMPGLLKMWVATLKWVPEFSQVGRENAICKDITTVMISIGLLIGLST